MGQIGRMSFVLQLWIADAIAMVFWLYFQPSVAPIVEQFPGPFSSQWELLQWAWPTTCIIIALLGGGYLLIGGAQEEQARQKRVR